MIDDLLAEKKIMLVALPVLNDNYIWLYARENSPIIVIDMAEIQPVLDFVKQNSCQVAALLLTHNHYDHIAGVGDFKKHFPQVPIYGPSECAECGVTEIINQGQISLADYQIEVIPTGGHTLNHLSYLIDGHLFCGDSLFSAGCGRVFTQDYSLMFASIQWLNQLPEQTLICAGHEYTLANLAFAEQVLADKEAVHKQQNLVKQLRAENKPSMPTTLKLERQINPFLQAKNLAEFIALRQAKDNY